MIYMAQNKDVIEEEIWIKQFIFISTNFIVYATLNLFLLFIIINNISSFKVKELSMYLTWYMT